MPDWPILIEIIYLCENGVPGLIKLDKGEPGHTEGLGPDHKEGLGPGHGLDLEPQGDQAEAEPEDDLEFTKWDRG